MLKGDVINGYIILQDFIVAGGMSKVSFASKGGKEYFIKEFLYPKYPLPDSPGSERVKEQKKKACDKFEKHHLELNKKIASKVSLGGNLVFAVDFFRYGPCYYKVTEKIDTESLSCKDISCLSIDSIILISRCVCHSLRIMHDLGIVHGDLKPDNILIKRTTSAFSGKLIDFDDSYFTGIPPANENLVGTPEYYSPEQAAYIMDEDGEIDGKTLTLKSDIFTLGIILCEYFTGSKPIVDDKYKTVWNSVNHGIKPKYTKRIPDYIAEMLSNMLQKDALKRPAIEDVFCILKERKIKDLELKTVELPKKEPMLKGKGLSKSGIIKKCEREIPVKLGGLRGKGLDIAKK